MNEVSRKFNQLLDKEVERRAKEPHSDEYYAQHMLMEDLSVKDFDLGGKTVHPVYSSGGPGSETSKWLIVVEYEGALFMTDTYFDSYEYAELSVFREAESYVEPVTKYRVKS